MQHRECCLCLPILVEYAVAKLNAAYRHLHVKHISQTTHTVKRSQAWGQPKAKATACLSLLKPSSSSSPSPRRLHQRINSLLIVKRSCINSIRGRREASRQLHNTLANKVSCKAFICIVCLDSTTKDGCLGWHMHAYLPEPVFSSKVCSASVRLDAQYSLQQLSVVKTATCALLPAWHACTLLR